MTDEERKARVHYHMYETCEGIAEHAERIVRLEEENTKLRELVQLMVKRHAPTSPCKNVPCGECPVKDECDQEDALMRELGIEVEL